MLSWKEDMLFLLLELTQHLIGIKLHQMIEKHFPTKIVAGKPATFNW